MGLRLFLVPTVGGYWFLTHCNYTRYRAFRDSGYHVLFSSAFVGALLFGVAHMIIRLLNHFCPQINAFWAGYFPAAYSDTVVLSVVLGAALPLLINRFYDQERGAQRVARENNDFVELLLAAAISRRELVELSLHSGKSYIGFVVESGIKRQQGEPDVVLVPMLSGYRDQETRELKIITHYATVMVHSLATRTDLSQDDFRIVIPMSEIVSARLFFPEAYELFQEGPEVADAERGRMDAG